MTAAGRGDKDGGIWWGCYGVCAGPPLPWIRRVRDEYCDETRTRDRKEGRTVQKKKKKKKKKEKKMMMMCVCVARKRGRKARANV